MGITRKNNKFLTSLAQNARAQNVGYKNKSKKKNKVGMVGGSLQDALKRFKKLESEAGGKIVAERNSVKSFYDKGDKKAALVHWRGMKMYQQNLETIRSNIDEIQTFIDSNNNVASDKLEADLQKELREYEADEASIMAKLQKEVNAMDQTDAETEIEQLIRDDAIREGEPDGEAGVQEDIGAGVVAPARAAEARAEGVRTRVAIDDTNLKGKTLAGKVSKDSNARLYPNLDPVVSPVSSSPPEKAPIENTKQALLQSIELCIKVQNSNGKDEGHTIDSKIIVAINATLNSENYIFSKNTLTQAIEAISSITKNNVTYSRDVSRMDMDRFITETKSAVDTAGNEAKSVLGKDEKLHELVTSIVEILPYYKIDTKNAFSIIAVFTILAAKGHVNFASSIPLTIPALNSFMAALNAYEASLELEAINENLNKQTEGTEDDKAPSQTHADIIPLQIAQVKAAKNLARKLKHYFNMCVVLETEANSSENDELSNKAKALRINAYKYYKEAEKAAKVNEKNKTLALGDTNEVNTSLRILTRERLKNLKSEREKIDDYVKDIQKSQNKKTTIEDKIKQLIVHFNSLLDNKHELYDSANTTAELNNSKAKEEQAYIESINKIMNYLNEKNIDLKYYWIEIVTTKDDKDKLLGKLGIIKELNGIKEIPDTDADVAGLWYFDLWIPDDGGTKILSPLGAVSKYMKVITKDKKTFNSFVKTKTPSIYSIRFLVDIDKNPIKYDPYLPNNILPDVTGANTRRIDEKNPRKESEGYSVSGSTRAAINKASAFGSGVNKYTLGLGEFKSKYKIEIEKILDHEIDDEDQKKLLKTVIVYSNKKLSIRDILATNISSIFAKGETSLNVFRQQNLKKNFEKKKTDPEDEEGNGKPVTGEGEGEGYGGEQEEEEDEEDGEADAVKPKLVNPNAIVNPNANIPVGKPVYIRKGKQKGGALQEEEEEEEDEEEGEDTQTGGLGGYSFRNFDRDDALKFITFILTSLLELKTINSDSDSKNKLNNNQALLFEKYLRTLFGKVGPKTLNGLLPQIDNAIAVSGLVIKHFKIRLTKDNEGKQKGKDEGEGKGDKGVGVGIGEEDKGEHEEEATPAKQISQLNFSLKHNVGPFVAAIIDITLNTQELKGSEGEIENYLDRKFDLAMKKPQDKEQTRISNSELRDVFKSIFGPNMSTINIYRERITKMDELIDAINDKNITKKIKEINSLLVFAEISKGVITYKMPDKIKAKLEKQPTDETVDEKLARALALIDGLTDDASIQDVKTKAKAII